MEILFPPPSLILAFCLLLIVLFKKGSKSKPQATESLPPPGPWKLPIIGNMHHLVGALPHRALRDLARKHGPLMLLRLGQVDIAVASSREVAEEIMKTHDLVFASRPELVVGKIIFYDCKDIAFSAYDGYYRQLRKICVTELLSTKRVKSFSLLREEEALNVMRDISMTPPNTPVNLREKLMSFANNTVSRAAFGTRCEQQQKLLLVVKEAVESMSGFSIADLFPSLKFVDVLSGLRSRLERIHQQLDEILDEIIRQHEEENAGQATAAKEENLVDLLLRIKDRGDLELPLTLTNVKAVILDIFLGGTETSASTIEWVMSALMKHPRVMKKAEEEVREAFRGRTRVDRDAGELSYLKLVIKETLRLYPTGPLLLPRVCTEACRVLGYEIPAGSRVLVNYWAIGRDPRYWDDPESFRPERFENSPFDFKGASFEYVPFGAGRRMCPGIAFGIASVELALAQLLFYFDWQLPNGMKPEDLDMTEISGVSASRKSELCLTATPRMPLPNI